MLFHSTQGAYKIDKFPAVSFDGNDALLRAGDAVSNVGNGVFTLECWFNITGLFALNGAGNRNGVFYSQGEGNVNRFEAQIVMNASGVGTSFILYSGVVDKLVEWNTTISANTWHHVAMVRETAGASLKCYFNGILLTATSNALGSGALSSGVPSYANIGRLNYPNYEHYFIGDISNLRFVPGTAVYTGNFTPGIPLSNISGTAYLMCASAVSATDDISSGNRDFSLISDPVLISTVIP